MCLHIWAPLHHTNWNVHARCLGGKTVSCSVLYNITINSLFFFKYSKLFLSFFFFLPLGINMSNHKCWLPLNLAFFKCNLFCWYLILQFYRPQNLRVDIPNHKSTLSGHNLLNIDASTQQMYIWKQSAIYCCWHFIIADSSIHKFLKIKGNQKLTVLQ